MAACYETEVLKVDIYQQEPLIEAVAAVAATGGAPRHPASSWWKLRGFRRGDRAAEALSSQANEDVARRGLAEDQARVAKSRKSAIRRKGPRQWTRQSQCRRKPWCASSRQLSTKPPSPRRG